MFERSTRRYSRPDWRINSTFAGGERIPARISTVWQRPFCNLINFERQFEHPPKRPQPNLLIVAPMSGHYPSLLRGTVEAFLQEIPQLSELEISQEDILAALKAIAKSVLDWLAGIASSLGTTIGDLFISFFIFLVLLIALLPKFDDFSKLVNQISPLDTAITELYERKALAMIRSMVMGVFLMAIIEGTIMGFFYWLAGVPFVLLWTFLSILFGMLPVVGISFIVLPMSLIMFLSGNPLGGVIVLFGFYVVVNPMDLWLRPRLVTEEARINFVLILLGMLGGMYFAGLLGLIYGPVLMILFVTTVQIYRDHFKDIDAGEDEVLVGERAEELRVDGGAAEQAEDQGKEAG